MNIEEKINLLLYCKDHQKAYKVFQELIALSEKTNELYYFFDRFVEMMDHPNNSYIRTRGIRLIAYQAKWDHENRIETVIDQWLKHIEDEKPITARQCIQDSVMIARYKPELSLNIIHALETYHRIYQDSMQNLIYKDRQKAIRQIKQLIL
ncbi:MAG: hypothetical protein ACI4SR_07880 [Faecalibacillus sp.]